MLIKHKKIGKKFKHIILWILCFGNLQSYACSCSGNGNIFNKINESNIVFYGKLVGITVDSVYDGGNNKIEIDNQKLKFEVTNVLNEGVLEKAKKIIVESLIYSGSCGIQLEIGDKAIIFSKKMDKNGKIVNHTSLCLGNILNPFQNQIDSVQKIDLYKK